MKATPLRIVSWNVAFRVDAAAGLQGAWLAALAPRPTVVLLQEANPRSIDSLCAAAGLDWYRLAVDVRVPQPDDAPVRRRGVAIAGRGPEPSDLVLLADLPLPERALGARLSIGGIPAVVASYYAPPGVSWLEKKPQQAVGFARWLSGIDGPIVFGADANTPLVDAIDFAETKTHWHTGDRRLRGAEGDDLLFGPNKIHGLDDSLRRWLATHPEALAELVETAPGGPLRLSHRTGKRLTRRGTDRRFDSIWVTPDFEVSAIDYPYAQCIAAGSDHAAVVADLVLNEARKGSIG